MNCKKNEEIKERMVLCFYQPSGNVRNEEAGTQRGVAAKGGRDAPDVRCACQGKGTGVEGSRERGKQLKRTTKANCTGL